MNEPLQAASQNKKPWWTVIGNIGAVVGIISLPLSLWLYFASVVSPGLTFRVNPAKAVVVKSGQSSRLRVTLNGKPVKTDITAAQVAVWNSGRAPIARSSVLEGLVITTPPNVPILEASIRKSTRGISNVRLDTTQISKGRLRVGWQILEKNDGAVIQIVYAGSPNANINARAAIIGQSSIYQSSYSEVPDDLSGKVPAQVAVGIIGLFVLGFMVGGRRSIQKQMEELGEKPDPSVRVIAVIETIFIVCCVFLIIFGVIRILPGAEILFPQTARPPFDI